MIAMFGMTGYSLFYSNKGEDTNAGKITEASTYSFEQSSDKKKIPLAIYLKRILILGIWY